MIWNIGKTDQITRIILGAASIGSLTFRIYPPHQTLIGSMGAYLFMSGYAGTCLIYTASSINTSRNETDKLIFERGGSTL